MRLPELLHLYSLFKSNPLDQAELFNTFFYKQFSDARTYDVNIDSSHSEEYHIDFNVSRVQTLLKNINSNRAMEPEKIHGRVLKNCASSLSKPLSSLLITTSYYSSSNEWKLALVVPVYKKDQKQM